MRRDKETCYLGTFKLASGLMVISDPCYLGDDAKEVSLKPTTADSSIVIEMAQGNYSAEIDLDDGSVSQLSVLKHGATVARSETRVAEVGVDSGQMMIGDLVPFKEDGWSDDYDEQGFSYGGVCELTLSSEKAGVVPAASAKHNVAAASSSGHGDGVYDVDLMYNASGTCVGARITFIEDEDEDSDW